MKLTQALLEAGADCTGHGSQTPIALAIERRDFEMIKLLSNYSRCEKCESRAQCTAAAVSSKPVVSFSEQELAALAKLDLDGKFIGYDQLRKAARKAKALSHPDVYKERCDGLPTTLADE